MSGWMMGRWTLASLDFRQQDFVSSCQTVCYCNPDSAVDGPLGGGACRGRGQSDDITAAERHSHWEVNETRRFSELIRAETR